MLKSSVYLVFLWLCVTVRASYTVYSATLSGEDWATNATGEVTVFVEDAPDSDGLYTIFAVGSVSGLVPVSENTSCDLFAGCGMHIHHTNFSLLFAYDHTPWEQNKYTTTSAGETAINWIIRLDRGDVDGKLFVVHNESEYPSATGILVQQTSDVWSVTTAEIDSSGVSGSAILFTSDTAVLGAGKVSGLSANVTDCSATDGCGAHVHSGTSCDSTSNQGEHYYNTDDDPWTTTGYTSTDSDGDARFVFSVESEGVDIDGRAFIIHMDDGTRASCGLISSAPTMSPTMSPTMAPTMAPTMENQTVAGDNDTMSPTMAPTNPDASGAHSMVLWACSLTAMVFHSVWRC